MKVLIVGNGGREHALAWKIQQSPLVSGLYGIAPNAGMRAFVEDIAVDISDHRAVVQAVKELGCELVVVGPEAPLVDGLADALLDADIPVLGPRAAAAQLEGSKAFSKDLMARIGVPTALYETFVELEPALEFVKKATHPLVVKASGLAAGKGVIICQTLEESEAALRGMLTGGAFGSAGASVVVEEFLEGEEASLIALCSGTDAVALATSQDHKRLLDGDEGLNTGGMGAYSPAPILQGERIEEAMDLAIRPILKALSEEGTPFHGFLYAGLMLTEQGPKVLEYNVRLGDPETQAILPRMKDDIVPALLRVARREPLEGITFNWDSRSCVCVVAAAAGYPVAAKKGDSIDGLAEAGQSGRVVFHAGTRLEEGQTVTSGGRVLSVVSLGDTVGDAIDGAYDGMKRLTFSGMQYRKDIGYRALQRTT